MFDLVVSIVFVKSDNVLHLGLGGILVRENMESAGFTLPVMAA